MKKSNPVFTKSLTTVLKKSGRIVCQEYEGAYLICNGFCIWKLTGPEYVEYVRPVTGCPAGNYEYTAAGTNPLKMDISQTWKKFVKPEGKELLFSLESFARFDLGSVTASALYSDKTIVVFNTDYLKTVNKNLKQIITDEKSPVIFVEDDFTPRAAILPIKAKPEVYAAISALHGLTATEEEKKAQAEAAALREELEEAKENAAAAWDAAEALRQALKSTNAEKDVISGQMEAAQAATEAAQAEAAALRDQLNSARPATGCAGIHNIDQIAARFSNMPGISVTVKGAQTAAPVLWFSGDISENAAALREAGARWSERRNAFYYKIA